MVSFSLVITLLLVFSKKLEWTELFSQRLSKAHHWAWNHSAARTQCHNGWQSSCRFISRERYQRASNQSVLIIFFHGCKVFILGFFDDASIHQVLKKFPLFSTARGNPVLLRGTTRLFQIWSNRIHQNPFGLRTCA